jgi:hypothetical protein
VCRFDGKPVEVQKEIVPLHDGVEEFEATVKNLRPFSRYLCAVRVRNKAGWSEECSPMAFYTEADCELIHFTFELVNLDILLF